MRLAGYTASVWVIVHRFLYFILATACMITGDTARLRPHSLYLAVPLFHILSHNVAGVIFEAVRTSGEAYISAQRLQVVCYSRRVMLQ